MDFVQAIRDLPFILAEGAVVERLRRDPRVELDPHVLHAGFIYSDPEAAVLAGIYREYLEIGRDTGLPILLLTPTWRANKERLGSAGLGGRDVNGDAVRFLDRLRVEYGDYAESVFIGGLIGARGDAYLPEEALSEAEATRFHQPQLEALARRGTDFLIAETLPAATEAWGIARAMAGIGLPYMLSFIIDRSGRLLDGTRLDFMISEMDDRLEPPPAGYLVNCVHHSVLRETLRLLQPSVVSRLIGCQANTSAKTPAELDGLDYLDSEEPGSFAEALCGLHQEYGLRILGGCCGTDGAHIRALAGRLAGKPTV